MNGGVDGAVPRRAAANERRSGEDADRAIVRAAQAKTRKMRRKQQVAHRPATVGIDPLNDAAATEPKSEIDWSKPAVPFEGEIWPSRRR